MRRRELRKRGLGLEIKGGECECISYANKKFTHTISARRGINLDAPDEEAEVGEHTFHPDINHSEFFHTF